MMCDSVVHMLAGNTCGLVVAVGCAAADVLLCEAGHTCHGSSSASDVLLCGAGHGRHGLPVASEHYRAG